MGKEAGGGERQRPPDGAGEGGRFCCGGKGVVRLQCVAALVLGAAVLLSALFWLPPFAGRGRGAEAPDPGAAFKGEGAALQDLVLVPGLGSSTNSRGCRLDFVFTPYGGNVSGSGCTGRTPPIGCFGVGGALNRRRGEWSGRCMVSVRAKGLASFT